MTPDEYQQAALRTENTPDDIIQGSHKWSRILHAMIGLCTEAGEFQDAMKKALFYGKPLDDTNIAEEIADCLWYCALGLDAVGVKMSEAMERNIAKLRVRFPSKFTEAQAMTRDLATERKALEGAKMLCGHPVGTHVESRNWLEGRAENVGPVCALGWPLDNGNPMRDLAAERKALEGAPEESVFARDLAAHLKRPDQPESIVARLRDFAGTVEYVKTSAATVALLREAAREIERLRDNAFVQLNPSISDFDDEKDADHALVALRKIAHAFGIDSPRKLRDGGNKRIAELCRSLLADERRDSADRLKALDKLRARITAFAAENGS